MQCSQEFIVYHKHICFVSFFESRFLFLRQYVDMGREIKYKERSSWNIVTHR